MLKITITYIIFVSNSMKKVGSDIFVIRVFYSQHFWPTLFSKLLIPYLKEEQFRTKRVIAFSIFFDNYRGEHVKLILKCVNEQDVIESKLQRTLKQFLSTYPSGDAINTWTAGETFFKDFDNNTATIIFVKDDKFLEAAISVMDQVISRCMLLALEDEDTDQETLFSLFLYMHIAVQMCCRDMGRSEYEKVNDYFGEKIYSQVGYNGTLMGSSLFLPLSSFNYNEIAEIVEDVKEIYNQSGSGHWLNIWIAFVKGCLPLQSAPEFLETSGFCLAEHLNLPLNKDLLFELTKLAGRAL